MATIEFTPEKLMSFRILYENSRQSGQESLMFEGKEFMMSVARYMIESMDNKAAQPLKPDMSNTSRPRATA